MFEWQWVWFKTYYICKSTEYAFNYGWGSKIIRIYCFLYLASGTTGGRIRFINNIIRVLWVLLTIICFSLDFRTCLFDGSSWLPSCTSRPSLLYYYSFLISHLTGTFYVRNIPGSSDSLDERWHDVGSIVGPTLTNVVGATSFCSSVRRNYQRLVRWWSNVFRLTYANVMQTILCQVLHWVNVGPTWLTGINYF